MGDVNKDFSIDYLETRWGGMLPPDMTDVALRGVTSVLLQNQTDLIREATQDGAAAKWRVLLTKKNARTEAQVTGAMISGLIAAMRGFVLHDLLHYEPTLSGERSIPLHYHEVVGVLDEHGTPSLRLKTDVMVSERLGPVRTTGLFDSANARTPGLTLVEGFTTLFEEALGDYQRVVLQWLRSHCLRHGQESSIDSGDSAALAGAMRTASGLLFDSCKRGGATRVVCGPAAASTLVPGHESDATVGLRCVGSLDEFKIYCDPHFPDGEMLVLRHEQSRHDYGAAFSLVHLPFNVDVPAGALSPRVSVWVRQARRLVDPSFYRVVRFPAPRLALL